MLRSICGAPSGAGCSIQFGTKISSAAPGSAQGLYLIVSDIEAARRELIDRGVKVGEVFHPATPGAQFRPNGASGRIDSASTRFASANDLASALSRAEQGAARVRVFSSSSAPLLAHLGKHFYHVTVAQ
jgi:hypothetical protein